MVAEPWIHSVLSQTAQRILHGRAARQDEEKEQAKAGGALVDNDEYASKVVRSPAPEQLDGSTVTTAAVQMYKN